MMQSSLATDSAPAQSTVIGVAAPGTEPRTAHRADVDWLRVLATYLLFVFHSAKVYDVAPFYHVKNDVLAPSLDLLTGFIHLWHMPLFFVLAGWSALGSLRLRRIGSFVRERASKLVVPLLFGVVAIGPLLRWAELRTGQFVSLSGERLALPRDVGFLEYLPTYFSDPGHLTWGHLWFLAYLFTFTLLVTPLLAALVRWPAREADPPRWLVYAPIAPLAFVQATLRERWPGFQNLVDDWANFSYYLLFFLLGAALAHAPGFERAVHREAARAAVLGLVAAAAMLPASELRSQGSPFGPVLLWSLSAAAGWCLIVALLGFAARRLSSPSPRLRWLAESAFPVYFLHQAGVVLAALLVIGLPFGVATKLGLTILLAVALTMLVYQLVVRRSALLRLLLGMKPFARHVAHATPS